MNILKKLICICIALAVAMCVSACKKDPDDGTSGANEPRAAFDEQAKKYSNVFFEITPDNISVDYSNDENIYDTDCYVYDVLEGLEKVGNIAVDRENEDNVFVSEDGTAYSKVRRNLDDLPAGEVKNISGDRMVCNVVDNSLYIYDINGSYGVLFQIIKIDDDTKAYTNDKISATNFNFDDYTDISILKSDIGTVTSYSDYYLYDKDSEKFVKNEALSAIPNIGVDGGAGTLSSYTRINSAENKSVTYSWVDGELVPLNKKVQKFNEEEDLYYIIEYEYDEDLNEVEVSSESYTKEELEALNS